MESPMRRLALAALAALSLTVPARADFIKRARTERKLSAAQIGRFINLSEWTVRHHLNPKMRARKLAQFHALARSKANV